MLKCRLWYKNVTEPVNTDFRSCISSASLSASCFFSAVTRRIMKSCLQGDYGFQQNAENAEKVTVNYV